MGYRGKVAAQAEARRLRASGMTLADIASQLHVSKISVSLWARDVEFMPLPRTRARRREPNVLQRRKAEEIERLRAEGVARIGVLSDHAFLVAGAALYAAEGDKQDHMVGFSNTDPRMVRFFCAWLRRFFAIDESRLRVRLYLHEGLGLETAISFWCDVTAIPADQFGKPYRAKADSTRGSTKHPQGCVKVTYTCSRTHRGVMGLVHALLASGAIPG